MTTVLDRCNKTGTGAEKFNRTEARPIQEKAKSNQQLITAKETG
jgi:hypothetical protein